MAVRSLFALPRPDRVQSCAKLIGSPARRLLRPRRNRVSFPFLFNEHFGVNHLDRQLLVAVVPVSKRRLQVVGVAVRVHGFHALEIVQISRLQGKQGISFGEGAIDVFGHGLVQTARCWL